MHINVPCFLKIGGGGGFLYHPMAGRVHPQLTISMPEWLSFLNDFIVYAGFDTTHVCSQRRSFGNCKETHGKPKPEM